MRTKKFCVTTSGKRWSSTQNKNQLPSKYKKNSKKRDLRLKIAYPFYLTLIYKLSSEFEAYHKCGCGEE